MKTVRFVMALHNHQPVGNFEHVFRRACAQAYHPFLDVAEQFPKARMVLHVSGSLFEWLQRNEPRLIERMAAGARAGRFEIMGGGFSEPILAMLPDRDAIGQIDLFRRALRNAFGAAPRGAWAPERVWEPHFPRLLADAGVEYTVVDDYHFYCAGLREADLTGYYITEDRGRLLRVFSGSEFLRYAIPFQDPEKTIEYLRGFATEEGRNVIVYADDGEKFGLWPETHKHVYGNGWLLRFFKALDENRDWIRFSTFADVLDDLPPRGKIFLPDASYREMTEWALPTPTLLRFEDVCKELKAANLHDAARPFMRGGIWRNYKVKYAEAAQMYGRMMEVSERVASREGSRHAEDARRELYRGQCNCPYWHGVFGGLYMPFLRFGTYQRLIRAENLVERKNARRDRVVKDFDFDGRPEVKLFNAHVNAYFKPDRGGAMYEFDDRQKACNLTAVMTRRPEAYHRRLVEAVRQAAAAQGDPGKIASIHDRVRWKETGLENLLHYDAWVRDSLVDHFYPSRVLPEELKTGRAPEWGDFVSAPYECEAHPSRASEIVLRRRGVAGAPGRAVPLILSKKVSIGDAPEIAVRYALAFPEGAPEDTDFAVELNVGFMAGDTPDRNYFSHDRVNLGNLSTLLEKRPEPALGVVDEWLGIELWAKVRPDAGFLTHPVETVNDSEEGFERVYQGSAIVVHWPLDAKPGEENVFDLVLAVRRR